jgi:hypothetical protein
VKTQPAKDGKQLAESEKPHAKYKKNNLQAEKSSYYIAPLT